jgi:hypothetical protein
MFKLAVLMLLVVLFYGLALGQTVTSFDGIDASKLAHKQLDFDPNGAVGTKQYMEWVNVYFQAFNKSNFAPVWSAPQSGTQPWVKNGLNKCASISGDGVIIFDRLASRWVIAGHSNGNGTYYYCVAVSNTDDLSSSTLRWHTYQFYLTPVLGKNSQGHVYFPDWPRLGTWADAYYVSFDLLDTDNKYAPIGVVACALDRTEMLAGKTPKPMQCFSDPSPIPVNGSYYLAHSLIPADFEGTTAAPAGRDEFMVSIQNPPNDGHSTTSNSINLWDFHVDWVNPANSTFVKSSLSVPSYTPGCYNVNFPARTVCVPEPSVNSANENYHIDSVGDRLMPRMPYRNFGTYESFLVSQTVQIGIDGNKQTGIRWYELRGSGTPALYQSGTIDAGSKYIFRMMPSIDQDNVGNAAVGYSVSSVAIHPGIRASWWNLPNDTAPKELNIKTGIGDEENSTQWGDYTSMTVDPVDQCTFWYVNEYFPANQTGTSINWNTRIGKFKVSTCTAAKK